MPQAKALASQLYLKNSDLTKSFSGATTALAYGADNKQIVITVAASTAWENFTVSGTTFNTMNGSKVFSDASGNVASAGAVTLTK